MARFDWTWSETAEQAKGPALVAVSLTIHVVLFGYLGLRSFDAPFRPAPTSPDFILPLDITPRSLRRGETRLDPAPSRSEVAASAAGRSAPPPPVPRLPVATAPSEAPSPASGPDPTEDRWRLRPAQGFPAPTRTACVIGGVTRDRNECANWVSAAPEDPMTGRSVRVGARTRSVGEQRRQIELDNQVAYNEAMRRYRRGEADYPLLRNVLKYQ